MPFLQDQQPYSYSTPTSTPQSQVMQRQIMRQIQALEQEYKGGYPFRDPGSQRLHEQKLIDDVYNKLGVAGTAGSGAAKSIASKAIVEYRLGLLKEEADYKEKVRQTIAQLATSPSAQGPANHITDVPGRVNPLTQIGTNATAALAGKAIGQQKWNQAPPWWEAMQNWWNPSASSSSYGYGPEFSTWAQSMPTNETGAYVP